MDHVKEAVRYLVSSLSNGKLKFALDIKYKGIDKISDAVDYLQSGKSHGKVAVAIPSSSRL